VISDQWTVDSDQWGRKKGESRFRQKQQQGRKILACPINSEGKQGGRYEQAENSQGQIENKTNCTGPGSEREGRAC